MGGIVYHANYLKFIERARSAFVRSLGLDQLALREAGTVFVVRRIGAEFLKPARFEERLEVGTAVVSATGVRLVLDQTVRRVPPQAPTRPPPGSWRRASPRSRCRGAAGAPSGPPRRWNSETPGPGAERSGTIWGTASRPAILSTRRRSTTNGSPSCAARQGRPSSGLSRWNAPVPTASPSGAGSLAATARPAAGTARAPWKPSGTTATMRTPSVPPRPPASS